MLPVFTNAITFVGNVRNGAVNNLAAASTIGGINLTNDGTSGKTNAFTLSGNSITLGGDITTTASTLAITDTISLAMILDGNRAITTNTNHNLIVSGIISETGGPRNLVKNGAGTLRFDSINTYSGTTTINAGTVEVKAGTAGGSAVWGAGGISLSQGATLFFNPTAQAIQNTSGFTVSGPITLSGGAGTSTIRFAGNDNKFVLSGGVTGQAGTTQTLALIQGGISNNGDRQSIQMTGPIADGSGGTLNVSVDFSNASSAAQKGYLSLSGQNSFTGNLTITNSKGLNGTGNNPGAWVTIGGIRHDGFSAPTLISEGTGYLGTGADYSGNISISNGTGGLTTLGFLTSANQILRGVISGTGSLNQRGSGTLTLTNASTFSGATTIVSGSGGLIMGNALALQNSPLVATSGAGSLTLFGTPTTLQLGGLSGASGSLGTIIASSGYNNISALTLNPQAGVTVTYGGALADGAAGMTLTKTGAGTQILSGTNTYTGGTTLSAGTLSFANGSLGSSGSITFAGNSTLQWNANTQDISSRIVMTNGVTSTIDTNGNNVALATGFGGSTSGALTKNGAGNLTLSGSTANTYTGITTVNAGALTLSKTGGVNAISGNLIIKNGATLSGFTNQIADTSSLTFEAGSVLSATVNDTIGAVDVTGGVAGGKFNLGSASNLTMSSLTLSNTIGTNDYSLAANGGSSTMTVSGAFTMNNAIYQLAQAENANKAKLVINGGLTSTGTSQLTAGGVTSAQLDVGTSAKTFNIAGSMTVDPVIIGSGGGITKTGTGTLILTNANNSYSGFTTLSTGTLQYASRTAFGTSTLQLADGTKLQKITEEANNASLSMANNIVLTGGQVEMNVDWLSKDQWFAGEVSGTGSIRITGTGSGFTRGVYLFGNNTFTGGVSLDSNRSGARLGHHNGLGTGTLTVTGVTENRDEGLGAYASLSAPVANDIVINSGRILNIGGGNFNMTLSGQISGAGNLNTQVSGRTYTLTGTNTYTGTTRVAGTTTLQLGSGGTTGALTGTSGITNDSNITINRSNDFTQATDLNGRAITGTGSFTQAGPGTTTLSLTNTYTGATNVNAGKLLINGGTSTSSAVTVANGATLGGSGAIRGSVTVQSGGTFAPGSSIESIATGNLALLANSVFAQEIDRSAAANLSGDLTVITGSLNITSGAILTLTEVGGLGTWGVGDKITLAGYSTGTWNGGLFTYLGNTLNDDSTFTFSGIDWTFNYNDTSSGDNYQSDMSAFTGSARYVTMTAIPEPRAALLGGLGLLILLRRRRS